MARTRRREPIVFKISIERPAQNVGDTREEFNVRHWALLAVHSVFCGKTLEALVNGVETEYKVEVNEAVFGPSEQVLTLNVLAYREEYLKAGDYEWQFDET